MAAGSKGNCYFCGTELGKTAMKNHLLKEHGEKDGGQACYLLKIEGAYNKDYWIYVDVPVDKTLSSLDSFLRKIWLECCGHMSAFFDTRHADIGKSHKWSTFSVGHTFLHEYDFGSTTESIITIAGEINRKPQKEVVRLLSRNISPQFQCESCGEPAEYLCMECVGEIDNPFYCAVCSENHEHDDMLLPVTNSPRMGECGYDGELDVYDFDPGKLLQKK
jgi:hypothetical protein